MTPDEELIQRYLAAQGKPMLPYTYGNVPDLPEPPALGGLPGMSTLRDLANAKPPVKQRNMTPEEIAALWQEQGLQLTVPPMGVADWLSLPIGEFLNEASGGDPTLLAAVGDKKAKLAQAVRGMARWNWQPGTKLADIPETVQIPRADPKALLVEDVARYLDAQVQKKLGTIPASASEKQKMQRLLKVGRFDLEDQLSKPHEETGVDWYTADTSKADDGLASVFPELRSDPVKHTLQKSVSAVMSNNSNPLAEAFNGARIYDSYRGNGTIPLLQPTGKEWPAQGAGIQLQKIQGMIDALGEQGYADFLMNPQTVADIRRFRPGAEGKAGDLVPGSLVLGPKVGRYFMDLMGMPQEGSTIDKWDMRGQMRRLGRMFSPNGTMIEVPTPESERPLFMQQHKLLGDEYGLTRNGTQSALWHYEQDLYRRLGLPVKSYKRSDGVAKFLGR